MGTKKNTLNYKEGTNPGDASTPPPYSKKIDVKHIERDVSYTRSHMDEVIDELSERISPRRLIDEIVDIISGTPHSPEARDATNAARDTAASVGERMRHDPIPFALIGAGIAWLTLSAGSRQSSSEQPPSSRPVGYEADYRKLKGELAAREDLRNVQTSFDESSTGGESGKMERGKQAAGRSAQGISHAVKSNPLAAGAVALGAGALMGFLMPHTRTEDQYLHEPAEKSRDTIAEKAQQTVQSAKRTAEEGIAAANDEARSQGVAPEQLSEQARQRAEDQQASTTGDTPVEKAERIVKSGTEAAKKQANKENRE